MFMMLVFDYPSARRPMPPRQVDNRLAVILTSQHHTYGDPVRGFVHLQNVRRIFLESIELKFFGENGTNIRYPKKRPVFTRIGRAEQTYYGKAKEKKILFQDSKTIVNGLQLEAGHHKWSFEFHFPHREEVRLAPNTEPFTMIDYYWFRYEVSANANFIDSNHTKGTLKQSAWPIFLDSRHSAAPEQSIASELAISRRPSVTERLPNTLRRTSQCLESFHLVLNTPTIMVTRDPLRISLMILDSNGENSNSNATPPSTDPCRRWRLLRFRLCLKYCIKLTAQNHTVSVNLAKTDSVELCSYSAKKETDAIEFPMNEPFHIGQKLSLKAPSGISPFFVNDLVQFEHAFKMTAEFEREGQTYNAKLNDIAVEVQPHYVQEALPSFEEAENIPPPSFQAATSVPVPPLVPPHSETRTPPPPFQDDASSDASALSEGASTRPSQWSPV
jgi:hypothetical protein